MEFSTTGMDNPMTILIIGLVLFFAVHFVPALTGLKRGLVERFGANGYQAVFTIVSLIGFLLIVWGKSAAEFVYVYNPPDWGRHGTMVLVLVAFVLLAAYQLKGRIRKTLRHPMLVAVAFWAAGHLLANGDLASVLMFGSFLAFAVIDIPLENARGPAVEFDPDPRHDMIALGGGIAAYIVFLFVHPWAFGVAII